jgi:YesN/AraC family two-component response regulator
MRMDAGEQVVMAKALKTTLQEYLSKPINKLETRKTVDEILSQMKENQTKHEKTTFATASTFNLETLQHLPDELRSGVCAKLGIVPTSNILKTNDYSTRKHPLGTSLSREKSTPSSFL